MLSLVLAAAVVLTGISVPNSTVKAEQKTPEYRNVVYYGDWSIYAGQKNFYPSKIDGSLITHLNFAFMDVDANGNLVLCDEHADFQAILPEQSGLTYGEPYAGVLGAMSILRSKYPNMKIGISVGGWTRSGDFPAVAADATKRKNFAKNITKFVDYLGYDFVDIDWEYPTAVRESDPQGNGVTIDKGCMGSPADKHNFTLLMQDLRDELDALGAKNNKHYELSSAMSASPTMMKQIEYDKVLDIVDFVNMMTYDLNGAWNGYTGHQTALYTNDSYDKETQVDGQFSVDTCIKYLEKTYGNKIDYSKVVIGVAPYTRGWCGVKNDGPDKDNPGLYATADPNSVKAADGTTSGSYAFSDMDELCQKYKLKEYYDTKAEAAYYYSEETGYFFTCDNERSVTAKGAYVREKGLGGLISWMASLEANGTITKVMKESLYGSQALPQHEIITSKPKVSLSVTASGKTYTLTIKNEEKAEESNTALKDAELFKKTVMFPKLYIKTKSGAAFTAGSESGSVTNQNGCGVVDLAGVYAGKSLKPGASHTFTINCSADADVTDIVGVTLTQRILTSMDEFGTQVIFGEGAGSVTDPDVPSTETEKPSTETEKPSTETEAPSTETEKPSTETETEAPSTETEKPSTETEAPSTGNYPEWKAGTTYKVGDLVSYLGKIYECIYAHTCHIGWLPDQTPTLWKLRSDLANAEKPSTETEAPSTETEKPSTETETEAPSTETETPSTEVPARTDLPAHMVTGYWHNFVNGSANLKLSDVPSYYDMICVAFTGNTATAGEVTFELDADLCKALGGYTKAEFIKDIKDLQAKGQHVIISVGGAEGRIEINSQQAADIFAADLIAIIEEYGFEGVDIDLEGSAVSGVNYIAGALRTVQKHFGEKFIITMAPETFYIQADRISANDITTAYLRLALEIKDILTICYPQYYNSGGMNGYGGSIVNPGNADFLTSLTTLLIEAGLRPDQVAIGVPSTSQAAGSGYVSTDTIEKAIDALVNGTSSGNFTVPKAYPGLRGVMTWSINWDATNNYAWGKAMSDAMDKLNNGGSTGGSTGGETGGETGGSTGGETGGGSTGGETGGDTGRTTWDASTVYVGGEQVYYNGKLYEAKWWTTGENPEKSGQWGVWKLIS